MVKPFISRFLYFTFILIHFVSPRLFAQQNSVLEPGTITDQKKDTLKILIIPYNPEYYLSDSDRQISEASKKSVFTVRESFRMSLDQAIKQHFNDKYFIHSVLTDTSEQAAEDLKRIYGSQVLKYEESATYQKEQKKEQRRKGKQAKGIGVDHASQSTDNTLLDDQYMNVTFRDQALLPELARRYKNDYFILLNQFELRIDYNDCLDLARKIYNRKLKVHYSIYDNEGNFISGDYIKVVFPSTTNHVNEIISRNFYHIAHQLEEVLRDPL